MASLAGFVSLRSRGLVDLYQAIVFFLFFLILSYLSFKSYRKKYGDLSVVYITALSFSVFLLEFLKAKPVYLYYHISLNHLLSLVVFFSSIAYIFYRFAKFRKGKA